MMKDSAKFKKTLDKAFKNLLTSNRFFPGWANRILIPEYGDMQLRRWKRKNSESGGVWHPLNKTYAKSKLRRYASMPGGGRTMMIATSRLLAGIIPPKNRAEAGVKGPKEEFRKAVTKNSVILTTSVPYAKEVNEEREFTSVSQEQRRKWALEYAKYLARGLRLKADS